MSHQEAVKPLVDRILSQPLHFRSATHPDTVDLKPSSYVVIGKVKNTTADQATVENRVKSKPAKRELSKPKSFAEALAMYTTKRHPVKERLVPEKRDDPVLSDDEYQGTSDDEQGVEDNSAEQQQQQQQQTGVVRSCGDESSSAASSATEEFHEAKEYLDEETEEEDPQRLAQLSSHEDLGEDIGDAVYGDDDVDGGDGDDDGDDNEDDDDDEGDASGDSHQDPEFQQPNTQDDDEEEDEDEGTNGNGSDSEVSMNGISDDEKTGLLEEAQEHAMQSKEAEGNQEQSGDDEDDDDDDDDDADAEPELKHKLPSSQQRLSSPTPPTTISDIDNFYEFNENVNDHGTNSSSRIVKNWGPQLSQLKPKGLLNHGVTCYTNAAVQAMLHIPSIQHYLFDVLRGDYKTTISPQSVTQVLAETSKRMWSPEPNKNTYINPKKLIGRLDDINCMMSEWQQEDSHEYFMSLMSRLQEDSVPRGHKLTESIIYDIFGGLLHQKVTCKSCGGVSKTEQPFYDLSLHLKGKKKSDEAVPENQEDVPQRRYSIEKSISDFFNPELIKVDKKDGYVCEKCHKTTNAIKRNSILRAPETLLIHLKKFRFNGTSSSKMKQAVSYPMFLDMSEYCEDQQKTLPVKYQLISVVVHEGRSLSSGHYIAHCKQPDGSWATYDDEYINKITEKQMLKEPGAYYLIYTRLTPRSVSLNSRTSVNALGIPKQNTGGNSNGDTSSSSSSRKKKKNKNKKRKFNRN